MPGVVVYLISHSSMPGASVLIPSLPVNCTLNSLAKSPNQCCKLSLKSPEGSGIIRYLNLNLNLNFRVSIEPKGVVYKIIKKN